jgi:DNA modification methylase
MSYEIRTTDVFDGLAAMPEKSVHCCVTSPPYWALRDYGTAKWEGGNNPSCEHKVRERVTLNKGPAGVVGPRSQGHQQEGFKSQCPRCGAKRIDRQLGQEATPQEFVATLVRVFAGVHRVLRDDGVLFVNLGDSYADKSRCLIPERFVIAMQEFGWYVRDIIVWHKPAPMPVSVRDRCTPAWEPIYQFTKSPRYFWDQEAVKVKSATAGKPIKMADGWDTAPGSHGAFHRQGREAGRYTGAVQAATANPRNVWRISTEPMKAKHYAAFPSELPTRCIKAATSERGVCSRCLAPWVRVVERKRVATRPGEDSKVLNVEKICIAQASSRPGCDVEKNWRNSTLGGTPQQTQTVDWQPTCQCNADTIPATVLDPFSGAGTTCLAAARLGRHGIGLELNPEYVTLSIQRIETELAKHAAKTTMVRSAKVATQPGTMDLFATIE